MKTRSILGLLAVSLMVVSCGGENKSKTQEQQVPEKVLIKAEQVSLQDIDQKVDFVGTIDPFVKNNIGPGMQVRISDIKVDVGAFVKKGQLLVETDKTQYNQAKLQLANLEMDYERLKALLETGGVSKQQLDQMETSMNVSRESLKFLEENIRVTSPINGVVTARNYDPGDMYLMNPPILTVMQIDRLKVIVNVSESYFPSVKTGMPVEIKADMFPDQVFEGKVSLVYPSIDAATRTFSVEITIANPNLKLRPGMFCRVDLNFGAVKRVVIPDVALQKQAGTNEKFVYVIENGVAKRTLVEVGRHIGKVYEVLSGLNGNEVIATAGAPKLSEGAETEISNN